MPNYYVKIDEVGDNIILTPLEAREVVKNSKEPEVPDKPVKHRKRRMKFKKGKVLPFVPDYEEQPEGGDVVKKPSKARIKITPEMILAGHFAQERQASYRFHRLYRRRAVQASRRTPSQSDRS